MLLEAELELLQLIMDDEVGWLTGERYDAVLVAIWRDGGRLRDPSSFRAKKWRSIGLGFARAKPM
jgi:hypothetical protein